MLSAQPWSCVIWKPSRDLNSRQIARAAAAKRLALGLDDTTAMWAWLLWSAGFRGSTGLYLKVWKSLLGLVRRSLELTRPLAIALLRERIAGRNPLSTVGSTIAVVSLVSSGTTRVQTA